MNTENSTIANEVNEILENHGLDFSIKKLKMVAILPLDETETKTLIEHMEGATERMIPTDYFGLYNTKNTKVINAVKDSYHVSQNFDILNMVFQGISKFTDKVEVSKAGSINEGRRVFIQLRIKGKAKVGNDTLEQYITIIDSNDGSTSLSVGIGDEVARCTNQFWKFYKVGQSRFRHTASIEQRIAELPELIEIALDNAFQQLEVYNRFKNTVVDRELVHTFVNKVYGIDRVCSSIEERANQKTKGLNIMNEIYNDIDTEINQVGTNLWALFGGITRFTTHHQTAPKRDNGRFESQTSGQAYKLNQKAFDFCLEYLNKAA